MSVETRRRGVNCPRSSFEVELRGANGRGARGRGGFIKLAAQTQSCHGGRCKEAMLFVMACNCLAGSGLARAPSAMCVDKALRARLEVMAAAGGGRDASVCLRRSPLRTVSWAPATPLLCLTAAGQHAEAIHRPRWRPMDFGLSS